MYHLEKKDDNLVYAYIRFICDGINVNDLPLDILDIIDSMYGFDERVHVFFDSYVEHYAIDVSDILLNC